MGIMNFSTFFFLMRLKTKCVCVLGGGGGVVLMYIGIIVSACMSKSLDLLLKQY